MGLTTQQVSGPQSVALVRNSARPCATARCPGCLPLLQWRLQGKFSQRCAIAEFRCCYVQVESFLQTLCEDTEIAELELKVRFWGNNRFLTVHSDAQQAQHACGSWKPVQASCSA